MRTIFISKHFLFTALAVAGMAGFAADRTKADEVEFHNLSNEDIFIAVYHPGRGIGGWTRLASGEDREYRSSGRMYFHVGKGNRPVTWNSSPVVRQLPINRQRFNIERTDTSGIHRFRWGSNLEHSWFWREGTAYPQGFFRVGFFRGINGNHYHVMP